VGRRSRVPFRESRRARHGPRLLICSPFSLSLSVRLSVYLFLSLSLSLSLPARFIPVFGSSACVVRPPKRRNGVFEKRTTAMLHRQEAGEMRRLAATSGRPPGERNGDGIDDNDDNGSDGDGSDGGGGGDGGGDDHDDDEDTIIAAGYAGVR